MTPQYDENHCTLCRRRAGLPVPDVFADDPPPTPPRSNALAQLHAEVEKLRRALDHAVSENFAFNVKAATEINEARASRDQAFRQLAAVAKARDEACDIADGHIGQYPYQRRDILHAERIAELRKVGQ